MMRQKIKGKKRHILSYLRPALHAVVHPADIQDRDGGVLVSPTCSVCIHFCKSSLLMADIRPVFQKAFSQNPAASANRNRQTLRWAKGFELLPRRWFVERTFAWLNRLPRLAKDSKISPETRSLFSTSPRFVSCSEVLSELITFDRLLVQVPTRMCTQHSRTSTTARFQRPREVFGRHGSTKPRER